jgi:neutral trehalase
MLVFDFSNAWAPLQEIIVSGLENTKETEGEQLAVDLVQKWVKNNYVAYLQSKGKMFEKYDVEQVSLN